MPRGKEPSWPVQKLILELLSRHGNQPVAIQRSLDILISQQGISEDTPGLKQIEKTIKKLQELDLDVLVEFPPSVWKKRRDYGTIKDELERLTGKATRETTPEVVSEWGLLSRLEISKLEDFELHRKRIFPPIRQLEGLYDLAARLQIALSRLSAKDWAVWELPDAPWLSYRPTTSSEENPAELKARIDRGRLKVDLAIEEDKRFTLLLIQLQAIFPEFSSFQKWKQSLAPFISSCHEITREIWYQAETQTGLKMCVFDPGSGFLRNVPLFIYEFALDNYGSGNQPRLELLPHDASRHKSIPEGCPEYILAVGSEGEMMFCGQITAYLCGQYARDERIGKIKKGEADIRRKAEPFKHILSEVLAPFRK